MARKEGYAEIRKEYNGKKQVARESYFGTDGLPFRMPDGYYGRTREYDEAGNVSRECYLDADGKRMGRKEGYAEIRKAYNEQKQVIRKRISGQTGSLSRCRADTISAHVNMMPPEM